MELVLLFPGQGSQKPGMGKDLAAAHPAAREVFEEAGVRVRDVRYVASQPWPFPSQLMIGCHAIADDPTLAVDFSEIEDARWFPRHPLAAARAAGAEGTPELIFPRSVAIAHHLVTWWLDR